MRIGCDLPYFSDPGEIRAFAQAAEQLGYDHLGFSEHVASSELSPFPPRFTFADPWHESFTMLGFLAAATSTIELCSAMLLLTLRPTPLAAKQAAEIDLLSGGRLRLCVSVGWDTEEVRALGVQPSTRGQRLEEQVGVMRLLLTQDSVTFDGTFHNLDRVGIHPRPGRPVPIWMGAGSFSSGGVPPDRALRRMARLADGYRMFAPLGEHRQQCLDLIAQLRQYTAEAGRDPLAMGIETRLITHVTTPDEWAEITEFWAGAGVSHMGLGNRVAGGTVDQQIELIDHVMQRVGPAVRTATVPAAAPATVPAAVPAAVPG